VYELINSVTCVEIPDFFLTKEGPIMDAIIGRYRARMEESGLVLRHISGINFDLTLDETLGLLDFINAYRQTLQTLQERDTDPRLERIVLDDSDQVNSVRPINNG
jgi:hypothetical protein